MSIDPQPIQVTSRILVSDIEASLAFYCGVLGLRAVHGFRLATDPPFTEVILADAEGRSPVTLQKCESTPVPSGAVAYPATVLFVRTREELDEIVRRVRERGDEIAVEPTLTDGVSTVFMPVDPDGYLVEVLFQTGVDEIFAAWRDRTHEFIVGEWKGDLPQGLLGHRIR